MMVVTLSLGGRNEGNIKSYTYIRYILVPPRHLCRLIPAWHPIMPVASRKLFILVGLLSCNGNHNPYSPNPGQWTNDRNVTVPPPCAGKVSIVP